MRERVKNIYREEEEDREGRRRRKRTSMGSHEGECTASEGISGRLERRICSCLFQMEAYMSVLMCNWPDEPRWVIV